MPFDGNGNWTSNFSAVADRNANIKIEASRFDNILLADIAQSFETCLTKDMQVKPQQNFDANNFRLINVADPVIGSDAVNLSTLDNVAVHKTGTENIAGDKTFTGSLKAPTKSSTTNSTDVATTAYVKSVVPVSIGSGVKPVYTNASGVITASNSDLGSATQPIYMDKGELKAGTALGTAAYVADTTLVHKTGNESIGGNKTFTSNLYVSNSGEPAFITKENDITKGTAPSSEQYQGFYCYDSAGNVMSRFRHRYATNKNNFTDIIVYKANAESDTANASISLAYPATGNPYATCPTPDMTTSTSSNRMVNDGWVNSLGNNVMHLTGDEEASGNKKFTGHITKVSSSAVVDTIFVNKNTAITKGTAPSSSVESRWRLTDSSSGDRNSALIAGISFAYNTSKRTSAYLQVGKPEEGSGETAYIAIHYTASGTIYTEAPTPSSATDNSTNIATTAWIHNHLSSSSVKSTLGGLAIPDYTTASETGLGNITSGHRFTAPQDGTLHVQVQGTYVEVRISLVRTNDTLELVGAKDSDSGVAAKTVWIPVKAGQTYEITGRGSTRFYAFFCALTAAG